MSDMELRYKDDSIELWANPNHPGWNLIVRPSANVIPVLPNGKILLISEHKVPQNLTVLGFPGGMIEDGESPAEAATREAAEELGIIVERLQEITVVKTTFPNTSVTYFLGWQTGETERKDWGEVESTREVTFNELFQLALDGQISDPRQVVAILALKKKLSSGEITL